MAGDYYSGSKVKKAVTNDSFLLAMSRQFIIKSAGWSYVVRYENLVYVEVNKNYCSFYFEDMEDVLQVRCSLNKVYLPKGFVKISRNRVVNSAYICSYSTAYIKVKWNRKLIKLESYVEETQFDNLFGPVMK